MNDSTNIVCNECDEVMVPMEAQFRYLNKDFRHEVLRCPKCGQIYIPEDIAAGKMRELEKRMEEK